MNDNTKALKWFALGITLIAPFVFIWMEGFNESLSDYWMTGCQPIFILTNAITSYHLFSTPKWRLPSAFLLLLTAFSVEDYRMIHNILAIIFFILCLTAILFDKRYRMLAAPYLAALFWVGGPNELLIAEIIAVYVLCTYHALIMLHYLRVNWEREKIKKKNEIHSNI